MRKAGEALVALLGFLISLVMFFLVASTSLGVVREYCLNTVATEAAGTVVVDKHWTYILWPPLVLSGNDPPGRCVRNTPIRQALDAVGIWKLPSPEEQVRRHVVEQIQQSNSAG